MIKLYPVEIIGVDTADNDRQIFKLRTFDETSAALTVDTVLEHEDLDLICDAIKQAMEMLELKNDDD